MINREELAWAAGFYEGEGSVGTYAAKGIANRQIHMRITQTDESLCVRFGKILGFGIVSPQSSSRSGLGKKQQFRWSVGDFEHVQAAVAMLWPWLSERRREQARQALLSRLAGWGSRPARTRK